MSLGLKKKDNVQIHSGKDNGKTGKIIKVIPEKNKVVVESANLIKKHMKPNRQFQQGGIIEKEAPIHKSNVMLICPRCNKSTRIGVKILETNKKVRLCKKCKEVID